MPLTDDIGEHLEYRCSDVISQFIYEGSSGTLLGVDHLVTAIASYGAYLESFCEHETEAEFNSAIARRVMEAFNEATRGPLPSLNGLIEREGLLAFLKRLRALSPIFESILEDQIAYRAKKENLFKVLEDDDYFDFIGKVASS